MTDRYKNRSGRQSNRYKYWDYSSPGSYFLTLNTKDRMQILGDINNGEMEYSKNGDIVKSELIKIPDYNERAILDEWIIMPNHVHMIVILSDYLENETDCEIVDIVGRVHEFALQNPTDQLFQKELIKQYRTLRRKMIIPKIMGKFQMLTSKEMNLINGTPGKANWQYNYHDHVIRNAKSHYYISQYIINNPRNWKSK